MKRGILAVFLVGLMLLSAAGPAVAAQADTSPDGLATGSDAVPDAWIDVDVTKDSHEMGWSPAEYEDDNGDTATLDAHVNESAENPVTYTATDVEVDEFGEFPRNDGESNNTASALDASEWTKDASGSAGTGTVADTTTAPGVDAVSFSTSGQGSSDSMVFTYDNFTIGSDVSKRLIQIGADVDTLESGATVEVRAVESDGDYRTVYADTGNDTSDADTFAASAGEGKVLQQQLGGLPLDGSGDGAMDAIDRIEVHVSGGNAGMDVAMLNAEKLGAYQFGDERYDEDDDGSMDSTRSIEEPSGELSITGFDTLGSTFDDAVIHDATYEMRFDVEDLTEAADVHWNVSSTEAYPNFPHMADIYYRLSLPDAYDLSYADAELVGTQELPDDRYNAVELAEGISDTEFENVTTWSDETGTYGTTGEHVLDNTIQPGQEIGLHYNLLWTDSDESAAFDAGGGAGQFASGDGGIFSTLWGKAAGLFGSILVALGIKRRRG